MKRIIECVPNFSEGRDKGIIAAITDVIDSVEGVRLLEVDPGASTNRTVVTFVGEPESVIEAAFLGIKMASEIIDMRKHKGAHPRMGATDVCPLVPVSGIAIEELIAFAHKLGRRVGEELNIPVYLYEFAATSAQRKNLADIRAGEYEGFKEKLYLPEWKPDYGPVLFNEQAGQTVIGVRDFLVAYNVNLNTTSVKRANSVAFDIREKGRVKTEDGTPNGKSILDENGEPIRIAGACKHVKAIGWYIDEYNLAQVSCNLTNIQETPVHVVFEEARKSAETRGMRVTGSELVGLIPKKCLLDAGRFYLERQKLSAGVSEEELIHIAVKSMGLDDLKPFNPREKVIEYCLEGESKKLVDLKVGDFANLTASEAPAPGGGSIAALAGALGASLGTMVANLSASKKGWEAKWQIFSEWAVKGQEFKDKLLYFVDEDTLAFNAVMDAYKLPKSTPEEVTARKQAIQDANVYAAMVPAQVMETAYAAYDLLKNMASEGNPNSITDAGVGALCIHTAIMGAGMNVLINLGSIEDKQFCEDQRANVKDYQAMSQKKLEEILSIVQKKIA